MGIAPTVGRIALRVWGCKRTLTGRRGTFPGLGRQVQTPAHADSQVVAAVVRIRMAARGWGPARVLPDFSPIPPMLLTPSR